MPGRLPLGCGPAAAGRTGEPAETPLARHIARWLLIAAYLAAGALHLLRPGVFLTIMPPWVPFPREVVLFTGACEVLGAVGLALPPLRRFAGLMLALYAVCVYPANIQHALLHLDAHGLPTPLWYHLPRLLLQPVIVWWALWAGEVVDWPFRRAEARIRSREGDGWAGSAGRSQLPPR